MKTVVALPTKCMTTLQTKLLGFTLANIALKPGLQVLSLSLQGLHLSLQGRDHGFKLVARDETKCVCNAILNGSFVVNLHKVSGSRSKMKTSEFTHRL